MRRDDDEVFGEVMRRIIAKKSAGERVHPAIPPALARFLFRRSDFGEFPRLPRRACPRNFSISSTETPNPEL